MSSTPSIFRDTKKERTASCRKKNCGLNGGYMCGKCRRMGQKLCRTYHTISLEVEKAYEIDTIRTTEISLLAAKEIQSRLLYEYVFDFIREDDLVDGKWLSFGLRDNGHTQRMVKLYKLFILGVDVLPKEHKWMVCKVL